MLIDSNIPLYIQIKNIIKEEVIQGSLHYGEKIPTELDLIDTYKVSRITIRKAISELVKENVLIKQQGKGTFVTMPKIERCIHPLFANSNKVVGFTELLKQQGHIVTSKILSCEVKEATRTQQEHLQLSEDYKRIIEIQRIRCINNKNISFEQVFFPYHLCNFLLNTDISGSLYDILNQHNIFPDKTAYFVIEAISAGGKRAKLLEIHPHDPVLYQQVVVIDINNNPTNMSNHYFIGNQYKIILG